LGTIAAFVVLLYLVGVVGNQQYIANRKAVNRIDHTGRLRMLGQRVVLKAILIRNGSVSSEVNSQFATARTRFETTLSALKSGNADLELDPASNSNTVAAIAFVESQWQELSKLSQEPMSASTQDHQLARLSSVGDELLQACQELMTAGRRELAEGQVALRRILLGCIVPMLFLGATTLWLWQRRGGLLFAEESLRATEKLLAATQVSEARSKSLMASSLDPLITINARGIVQTASDSVETVLGWKPNELIGENVNVLMPEPYRSEHDGYLENYRRTGLSKLLGKSRELAAARRDGTVISATVTLWRVDLPDQSEPMFMGTIRDITERIRSEAELEALNKQLVNTARRVGKAEIATSVLHNVGNVLNSVNVSAGLVQDKIRESGVSSLVKAVSIMEQRLDDLGTYVTKDERGKHLPRFLIDVSRQIAGDEQIILNEVNSLIGNIDHIKTIVTTQQTYAAGVSGVVEEVSLAELLEDAIRINTASMKRHAVEIIRQFDDMAPVLVDKQKLLQIVVNLISNAKYACMESENEVYRLVVSLRRSGEDRVSIEVQDNGVGIVAENLTRIFAHGFTTRIEGHGFGLHSAALATEELDGSLTAFSDGPGAGATFTLEIPYQRTEVSVCTT
jgi:PAS domain S-box-containing protein